MTASRRSLCTDRGDQLTNFDEERSAMAPTGTGSSHSLHPSPAGMAAGIRMSSTDSNRRFARDGEAVVQDQVNREYTAARSALTRTVLRHRVAVLVVFHVLAFAAIYLLSYVVRFDGVVPPPTLELALS